MKKIWTSAGVLVLLLAAIAAHNSADGQLSGETSRRASQPAPTITFDAPINTSTGARTGAEASEANRAPTDQRSMQSRQTDASRPQRREEVSGPRPLGGYRVAGVRIVDNRNGRVMPIDEVDLKPTIERIRRGERNPHRNDGSVYRNMNRKLPAHPNGYYREYVVPTKGISGPGPQRLVIGQKGEMYYTWDHYDNFIAIEGEE